MKKFYGKVKQKIKTEIKSFQVTTCFIKPIQIYRTVSAMLFGIYGLLIISYLQQSIHNIQLWRKKLLFLEFLPLNTYSHVQNHFLTDLHVIFALIDLNEQSNVVSQKTKMPCLG